MKRMVAVLLAAALLMLAVPARAADADGFEIDENGVLTRYTGSGGEVTVPAGVTKIGMVAFANCTSLTGVTIPGSVTVIGGRAFDGCRNLSRLTISEGVTEIQDQAFYDCVSLTSVTLPASVTAIGSGAFYDCKGLKTVSLPAGLTSIGAGAFTGTPWLASLGDFAAANGILLVYQGKAAEVAVPAGVTVIADCAFSDNAAVTAVTLPEGVVRIGNSAFNNCKNLRSVTFPSSLTSIGNRGFGACESLGEISLSAHALTLDQQAFCSCGGLRRVTVSADVTDIGDLAFSGCGSLTDLTVSADTLSIGKKAFSGCGALEQVVIRGRVEAVALSAFEGTPWLTSMGDFYIVGDLLAAYRGPGGNVSIPSGVRRIEKEAFSGCTGLTGVTIPSSVTEIGEEAFAYCTGLTELTLPASIASIGTFAFLSCDSLKRVRALGSPQEMGVSAFQACNALEEAGFPALERAAVPMKSENLLRSRYIYANEYGRFGAPVMSCLYWDGEGYVRVENVNGLLVVERYSPAFGLLSSRSLEVDMANYRGGVFIGQKYNFVITGEANAEEDDSAPVVTVTKYSKQWEKLGQGSLCGANTTVPFRFGSLRCAEAGDMLYVHTCHIMYQSEDCRAGTCGGYHQANLTFALRQSDLTVTDAQYKVSYGNGYVSHSFNQFILADAEGALIKLDLGDGSPRALLLQKYKEEAGVETLAGGTTDIALLDIPGAIGDNTTGVSAGGLAETERGVVTAWSYNGVGGKSSGRAVGIKSTDPCPVRNVYFSWTDKGDFSLGGTRILQVTDFPEDGDQSAGIPVLAPTGPDGGYILWDVLHVNQKRGYVDEEGPQTVAWVRYDTDGNVGEIHTAPGALSDCPPIFVNGKLVWYVTEDSVPVFYTLDESGLKTQTALWQAPEAIKVKTDGELVWWTDAEPFIDTSSRTMVPLRAVAEALGLTVTWDGQAREAIFADGTRTIAFPIGSTEARRGDGGTVAMDTAAVIVGGRTYAPIRYLAEYFGYQVGWDGKTKTVLLTKGA